MEFLAPYSAGGLRKHQVRPFSAGGGMCTAFTTSIFGNSHEGGLLTFDMKSTSTAVGSGDSLYASSVLVVLSSFPI